MFEHLCTLSSSFCTEHSTEESSLFHRSKPFLDAHYTRHDQPMVAFIVKFQVLSASFLQEYCSAQVFKNIGPLSVQQTHHAPSVFNVHLKLREVDGTLQVTF